MWGVNDRKGMDVDGIPRIWFARVIFHKEVFISWPNVNIHIHFFNLSYFYEYNFEHEYLGTHGEIGSKKEFVGAQQ